MASAVVVTSFDVLGKEVHYQPDAVSLRSLRREKRYPVPASPLVRMHWWRLVVDEVQLVQLGNVASMANKIEAQHRQGVDVVYVSTINNGKLRQH